MRNLFKLFILALFLFSAATDAAAQAQLENPKPTSRTTIRFAGFTDYPPFGSFSNKEKGKSEYTDHFDSALMPFVEEVLSEGGFFFQTANVVVHPYDVWLKQTVEGKNDIVFGIYHDTKLYNGLSYIMPAVINNDIIIIMLPEKISAVRSVNDLTKMKGAIGANEKLTDYVAGEIKKLNLRESDDFYKMYEQLFNGEIDYILSGYYTGRITIAELGLREYVAFSRTPLWTMPLFLGVSKYSQKSNGISNTLRKAAEKTGVRERVKQDFENAVRKIENQYAGKLPPDYVIKKPNIEDSTGQKVKVE